MKNEQAAALGRLGGLARVRKLSEDDLSRIGSRGAQARWEKERNKPKAQHVITNMLNLLNSGKSKARILFRLKGGLRHEEKGSAEADVLLANLGPDTVVIGTYKAGARFSDVINDLVSE